MKEIGSSGVGEDSNVMKLEEHTNQVQCVEGRVEFDPRLLRESRQTEIDFVNQLEVYQAVGTE